MSGNPEHIEVVQSLPVWCSGQFTAVDGANLGDPVADAEGLIPGDVYMLIPGAKCARMSISLHEGGDHLIVASDSEVARPGAPVHLDCCATFMSADGTTVESLILVELAENGEIAEIYLFATAPLKRRTGYALVAVDRKVARSRFAEIACVSFTRGTCIAMATGEQVAVEQLAVGDRVLTRDHGPQKIRWIGRQTVRAVGDFAPIRIQKGAMNNAADLVVSPNHRLFVYQRQDTLGTGRAELLVRARHLVNGDTVIRTDGGFVDYFQLLFDRHEIIYAEGIAAESLMIDPRTRPALPAGLSGSGRSDGRAPLLELEEDRIDSQVAADLLRRASAC